MADSLLGSPMKHVMLQRMAPLIVTVTPCNGGVFITTSLVRPHTWFFLTSNLRAREGCEGARLIASADHVSGCEAGAQNNYPRTRAYLRAQTE